MKGSSGMRKPPRRPNSIYYSKRRLENDMDDMDQENMDLTPPDPRSSSGDVTVHCLLQDIDDKKLILLISGHPSARSTALILQALRQQMSVATLDEYVLNALDWMITHDVLMLKMKKNSLFSRVIQADGVDAREQMARLVNTMASYPSGRNYFTAHHKTLLPCLIAVLRGKRLPSTTHDQLIACVQKMSIRSSCQKELITSGMLEWAVNHLDQKLNNYAFEYLSALIVNLSTNSLSHPLITRLADSIANSVSGLVTRMSHGQSCFIYNSLLLAILSCSRVRLRAKDTKLLETIKDRLESRRSCPLCNMHVPYLIAIIHQEAEYNRVPQTPTEPDSDKAGNSCEREIDSLDPLRPSTNELSGARLLIRKAYKDCSADIPSTPVPGQVQLPCKSTRSASNQMASRGIKSNGNHKNGSGGGGRKSEPRIGTATSQHTFVIETERRRPLMINIGLSESALEYKKVIDDREKKREEEERKKMKAKDEKDKERQKALRHIQLTSRKAPSLLRKELSEASSPLEDKIEKLMSRKTNSRLSMAKKSTSMSHHSIAEQMETPSEEKNNNFKSSTDTLVLDSYYQSTENNEKSPEDYTSVFGSRPKVARTPEAQSRSFF